MKLMKTYDISCDKSSSNNSNCHSLNKEGVVKLYIKFKTVLTEALTAIFYLKYEASFIIDKYRNLKAQY